MNSEMPSCPETSPLLSSLCPTMTKRVCSMSQFGPWFKHRDRTLQNVLPHLLPIVLCIDGCKAPRPFFGIHVQCRVKGHQMSCGAVSYLQAIICCIIKKFNLVGSSIVYAADELRCFRNIHIPFSFRMILTAG